MYQIRGSVNNPLAFFHNTDLKVFKLSNLKNKSSRKKTFHRQDKKETLTVFTNDYFVFVFTVRD